MFDISIFVLLFIAVVCGFLLGVWQTKRRSGSIKSESSVPKKYYLALTQLLNDDKDASINTFISNMEVNSETLEVHLALGGLLRRRGEFARAVRIHQNLLAQRSLSVEQLKKVQLELAIDYLKSGLLDRAEQLLKDFVNQSGKNKKELHIALTYLLDVYQGTHEWKLAIDIADRLTTRKFSYAADEWREKQAHYCCELAEELKHTDPFIARNWAKSAQKYDKKNIRALLILAELDVQRDQVKSAIDQLEKIPRIDPDYISEILELLHHCYTRLDELEVFFSYLKGIYNENKSLLVLQSILKLSSDKSWNSEFVQFFTEELKAFSETQKIGEALSRLNAEPVLKNLSYREAKPFIELITEIESLYLCQSCGFSGSHLHWMCPKCKQWNSMKPKLSGTNMDSSGLFERQIP